MKESDMNQENEKKEIHGKKKGFIAKLFERLDRKMKEKADETPCCTPKDKKGGSSCC